MEKEDLKLGEIYITSDNYIFKYLDINANRNITLRVSPPTLWYPNGGTIGLGLVAPFRNATNEEKHWLNKCIEAEKFIPKEEALKDLFVLPEKWCVEGINSGFIHNTNPNNLECKFLNSFNTDGTRFDFIRSYYYYIENNNVRYVTDIPIDRTLITIEQFREYVIKPHYDNINKSLINTVTGEKQFTIKQIEEILNKNYDGDDLDDLIKIFKKYENG